MLQLWMVPVAIILIYLLSSIKILREYERGVIFRLGRVVPQPKVTMVEVKQVDLPEQMIRAMAAEQIQGQPAAIQLIDMMSSLTRVFDNLAGSAQPA